jgi:hypothetical protein
MASAEELKLHFFVLANLIENPLASRCETPLRYSNRTRDCCFLFLLSALSTVPYLGGLGFYSDDWAFASVLVECKNPTLAGLCECLWKEASQTRFRPLQILELATLYKSFGLRPLGYHIVNSVVFCAAVVLFYMALRELGFTRLVSVVVASVYAFSPLFSTDRFWIAAAQANLSMVLCFACFYSAARASGANTSRRWVWLGISIVSLAGSIFAYESSAPLFALIPVLLYIRQRRLGEHHSQSIQSPRQSLWIPATSVVMTILIVMVKYWTQTYIKFSGRFLFLRNLDSHTRNALLRFIDFNFGAFTFGLPKLAWCSLREHGNFSIAFLSIGVWILTASYCWLLAHQPCEDTQPRHWFTLFVAGMVVYWLSYALFFPVTTFDPTTTGIENRVMIAMACGTAMSVVGVLGMAASLLSRKWLRNVFLASSLGSLCACGFIVIAAEGTYWRIASDKQHEVLRNVRDYFPLLPDGTVLLFDGVCPYIGPGIVFETDWDVTGALRVLYRNPTLVGDIINPEFVSRPDRLATYFYGEEHSYSYGDNLILYDLGRRLTCRLKDRRAAQGCLDLGNWKPGSCPPGREGFGMSIFFCAAKKSLARNPR